MWGVGVALQRLRCAAVVCRPPRYDGCANAKARDPARWRGGFAAAYLKLRNKLCDGWSRWCKIQWISP